MSRFILSRLNLFTFFDYDKIILIDKGKNIIREGKCARLSQNIKWQPSSLVENINRIAYNLGYGFDRFLDENGTEHQGEKVTIPPKLSIYVGNLEYSIGASLSQAEYWWLAQEVSDFLGLEITIIYPTPRVPPEATV